MFGNLVIYTMVKEPHKGVNNLVRLIGLKGVFEQGALFVFLHLNWCLGPVGYAMLYVDWKDWR